MADVLVIGSNVVLPDYMKAAYKVVRLKCAPPTTWYVVCREQAADWIRWERQYLWDRR